MACAVVVAVVGSDDAHGLKDDMYGSIDVDGPLLKRGVIGEYPLENKPVVLTPRLDDWRDTISSLRVRGLKEAFNPTRDEGSKPGDSRRSVTEPWRAMDDKERLVLRGMTRREFILNGMFWCG